MKNSGNRISPATHLASFFGSALLLLLPVLGIQIAVCQTTSSSQMQLQSGWELQSSAKVSERGELVSTEGYKPDGWYPVTVPTTVVAALVKAGVYPDPDFGMNLRNYPGMGYPIGESFSRIAMPADSPYAVPWWYRKVFELPASDLEKTVWLNFDGINYRANIWLNGQKIADTTTVAGAWRHYEFDITKVAHRGGRNVLAVEVLAPTEHDLGVTFVDWNPAPPDKDMGLFHEVYVATSGPVALRHPAVIAEVDSPANDRADLTVTAQAVNATDQPMEGELQGRIEGTTFVQKVMLAAHETKDVQFTINDYPQLKLEHPRLWWPAQMGKPELYKLYLRLDVLGKISDEAELSFGIRQITSEVTEPTRRLFRINGKPLLIRGGGWSNDFLMRWSKQRLDKELDYVADMGLNTIRLEGRSLPQEFYDETDRRGILVMAGWSCCDFWEDWKNWTPEDHEIAKESMRSQMLRLRSHPSLLMWLNGSDNAPPDDQEAVYLGIEKDLLWPNPILSSATAKPTKVHPQNGVRMTGPYDYVPPSYWAADSQADQPTHTCDLGGCGGAHGFNTETSAGPAVPPIESLNAMFGKDHVWPMDATWTFHAGGGVFSDLTHYTTALNQRYGEAKDAEDYAAKSQLMTYEGIRGMYEAYSKNKYVSTGVIQWMLNNAWPSTIWHLYDFYLRPGGGYFGAKIAMEPLHPLYSPIDRSVWVVSSQYTDVKGLKLRAKIYNLDMKEKFSRSVDLDAAADSSAQVFTLPQIDDLTPTYFLKLTLVNSTGKTVGSNFYWLSTTPETFDWSKSNWYYSPTTSLEDFKALNTLPKVKLVSSVRTIVAGEEETTHVTIKNPSSHLAFFVRLKLDKGPGGEEILPVLWEDNYISLLPGESREITARYAHRDAGTHEPSLEIKGWNVQ
jgi:exo-1,4-beta-D-glucosaminidase